MLPLPPPWLPTPLALPAPPRPVVAPPQLHIVAKKIPAVTRLPKLPKLMARDPEQDWCRSPRGRPPFVLVRAASQVRLGCMWLTLCQRDTRIGSGEPYGQVPVRCNATTHDCALPIPPQSIVRVPLGPLY